MNWKSKAVLLLSVLLNAKSASIDEIDVQNGRIEFQNSEVEVLVDQLDPLVNSINSFGYKLLREVMKRNENQNVVISPTSVASLMAMTLMGTVGQTFNEIADALGFSQNILKNNLNHKRFGEVLRVLNSNDSYSKTLHADAIFVDEHTQLRDVYRQFLASTYGGDAFSANFSDGLCVKTSINEWVKNHTNGKIENFLEQPLPFDTKVVLLSALYFSGQWAQPFLEDYTMKLPFHRSQDQVLADLMLNTGKFNYIFSTTYDMHMIAIPYNDSTNIMYALKPLRHKQLSLPELMNNLDYEKIDNLIDEMRPKVSVIRFPKMELKTNIDLKEYLKALGVKSIFSPTEANFALMIDGNMVANSTEDQILSRINLSDNEETKGLKELLSSLPNPGVHVDVVKHDVKITINEYGTEAVAASAAFLARTADLFYADSPFYFFIRNKKTKLVTFSAVIFDPTST